MRANPFSDGLWRRAAVPVARAVLTGISPALVLGGCATHSPLSGSQRRRGRASRRTQPAATGIARSGELTSFGGPIASPSGGATKRGQGRARGRVALGIGLATTHLPTNCGGQRQVVI